MRVATQKPKPAEDEDHPDLSTAADDPTAVFDEGALRAAGLDVLVDNPVPDGPEKAATTPDVKGEDRSSVVVSANAKNASTSSGSRPAADVRPASVARPAAPPARSGGLSWTTTFLLAVVLGLVAYFAIAWLKARM